MDLNIPIIETPPSSDDEEDDVEGEEEEESDDNSEDFRQNQVKERQLNYANKCYDLTDLELKTMHFKQLLNIKEEMV